VGFDRRAMVVQQFWGINAAGVESWLQLAKQR
jgi:hypothetical protein